MKKPNKSHQYYVRYNNIRGVFVRAHLRALEENLVHYKELRNNVFFTCVTVEEAEKMVRTLNILKTGRPT